MSEEESIFGMTPGMSADQRDAACVQYLLDASARSLQAARDVQTLESKLQFAVSALVTLCVTVERPHANPMGNTGGEMIAQLCYFLGLIV